MNRRELVFGFAAAGGVAAAPFAISSFEPETKRAWVRAFNSRGSVLKEWWFDIDRAPSVLDWQAKQYCEVAGINANGERVILDHPISLLAGDSLRIHVSRREVAA
jgi:hypothetical protein